LQQLTETQLCFSQDSSKGKKFKENRSNESQINVSSEIGKLKKVFLHSPGKEVELITPENAAEFLYNDIIDYNRIVKSHLQFKSILELTCQVLEASSCLTDILDIKKAREDLLNQILAHQNALFLKDDLMCMPAKDLSDALITGVPLKKRSLEAWISKKAFSLLPQPNMYFMRDTSVVLGTRVVSSKMASPVRFSESAIMRSIYEYHPRLDGYGFLLDAFKNQNDPHFTLEGGDILIASKNLLLVGLSERTTARAVDALIEAMVASRQKDGIDEPFWVLCVLLPSERSTIHLDMIFTFIHHEQAVIYEPYILGSQKAPVVAIEVSKDGEKKFRNEDNLLTALKHVGMNIDPIFCGGSTPSHQKREQENSGSNFFAFAPGKAISYDCEHTLRACESAGYKIFLAQDVLKQPDLLKTESPVIVAIDGTELSRGGGGPRCMTCPVLREQLS